MAREKEAAMVILAGAVLAISADTGSVFVTSSPPGAQVYLDGAEEPSATTPAEIRDLKGGKHEVRFVFPDAREVVREITVRADSQVAASASWTSARASGKPAPDALVKVGSTPLGASVSVDGKFVGKTPCAARKLAPGEHSFVLRRDGYEDYETSLNLKAGETRLLRARLARVKRAAEAPEVPKTVEKQCVMCDGKGHIPTTGCHVCRHLGYNRNTLGLCGRCGGKGTLPTRCNACRGAGGACRACGGSGKPACALCRGKGKIPVENPDRYRDRYDIIGCPYCQGSGLDRRTAGCRICGGSGNITLRKRERERRYGTDTFIYLKQDVRCWYCDGKDEARPLCRGCMGRAFVSVQSLGLGIGRAGYAPCSQCGGTGKMLSFCPACGGRGWAMKRKKM